MLTTPDSLLFLRLLIDDLQNELLHRLSRDGGEADRPVVPWVLQDLSKMMESGSAMTSASSLSTCGCIPLGPMDLWVSRLLT